MRLGCPALARKKEDGTDRIRRRPRKADRTLQRSHHNESEDTCPIAHKRCRQRKQRRQRRRRPWPVLKAWERVGRRFWSLGRNQWSNLRRGEQRRFSQRCED